MEKINVNIHEILETIKEFRDKYYDRGSAGYEALHNLYCLLVSTYIYRGW